MSSRITPKTNCEEIICETARTKFIVKLTSAESKKPSRLCFSKAAENDGKGIICFRMNSITKEKNYKITKCIITT